MCVLAQTVLLFMVVNTLEELITQRMYLHMHIHNVVKRIMILYATNRPFKNEDNRHPEDVLKEGKKIKWHVTKSYRKQVMTTR